MKIPKLIDLRDLFFLCGLGLMGYGLWLHKPWVAFAVCGAVLVVVSLFPGPRGVE